MRPMGRAGRRTQHGGLFSPFPPHALRSAPALVVALAGALALPALAQRAVVAPVWDMTPISTTPAVPRPGVVALPVSFHFAVRENGQERLLNNVHIAIDDVATLGRIVSAVSDGPFLLAVVPEGAYHVTATHAGRAQNAVIVVARGEPLRLSFTW